MSIIDLANKKCYSSDDLNNIFQEMDSIKIHLLTFQSREVLNSLLESGVYKADVSKSREQRDYKLDIEQLGGESPIWCFSPVGLKAVKTGVFSQDDFLDGSLFFNYKCEMSLRSGQSFNKFVLMELAIEARSIKIGLTHNAYLGAVVIPLIKLDNLVACYRLYYKDGNIVKWYYPDVIVEKVYKDKVDSIFSENFSCRK